MIRKKGLSVQPLFLFRSQMSLNPVNGNAVDRVGYYAYNAAPFFEGRLTSSCYEWSLVHHAKPKNSNPVEGV
ncbi:hypothetical protein MARHY0581 [Marinobacter nauticus ATCC 49840]|nr:hypothetical protein MARHY0581 [Marinobacter nauticus ATCC 49840]